jgi:hypothetical protein
VDETATRVLAWIEADSYGFCHHLESDAAKVLNKAGRTALITQVRERFEGAGRTGEVPVASSVPRDAVYARRRWADALRALYVAEKNVEAYFALTHETGLTVADCHALTTMLVAHRKPEDAFRWVERGIALAKQAPNGSIAGYKLATLTRVLLAKKGRGGEALQAAWAEFASIQTSTPTPNS